MRTKALTPKESATFRRKIWRHYKHYGRALPWRPPSLKLRRDGTLNPYRVLVSEIMLQQTQVDRVAPKYKAFLKKFPNVRALARASLAEVLALWQGLGYNRRAKALKQLAEIVVRNHRGIIPRTEAELRALPGVGEYTARAVLVFSYTVPLIFIETNIRTVFIHAFFPERDAVSDKEIVPLIAATLPQKNPRQWYYALMDYGVMLKGRYPNPGRKSSHYSRQGPFKDSERRIRGLIIKKLLEGPYTPDRLAKEIGEPLTRVEKNASALAGEGFVKRERGWLSLI